jgi:hypothetical protein
MDVYLGGQLQGSFDSRSLPSDAARFATLQTGYYIANHHLHLRKYDALQVASPTVGGDGKITMAGDVATAGDAGSAVVPTVGPNPARPGHDTADGIDIHKAGIDDQTGVYGAEKKGISQGCQLVPVSQWPDFMKIINAKNKDGSNVAPHFDTWIIRPQITHD